MSNIFEPKKITFRKPHKLNKGHVRGIAPLREFTALHGGDATIYFGENTKISSKQCEVIRAYCSKITKANKVGYFQIHVFCHQSVSKKSPETRMGGGKGAPDHYISRQKAGSPLVELSNMSTETISRIFYQAKAKVKGKLQLEINR